MDLGLTVNKNLISKQEPNEQKRRANNVCVCIYICIFPIKLEMR